MRPVRRHRIEHIDYWLAVSYSPAATSMPYLDAQLGLRTSTWFAHKLCEAGHRDPDGLLSRPNYVHSLLSENSISVQAQKRSAVCTAGSAAEVKW